MPPCAHEARCTYRTWGPAKGIESDLKEAQVVERRGSVATAEAVLFRSSGNHFHRHTPASAVRSRRRSAVCGLKRPTGRRLSLLCTSSFRFVPPLFLFRG